LAGREEHRTNRGDEVAYWLTPVKNNRYDIAERIVLTLVGRKRMYAFGDRAQGRKRLKPGDWICFYAARRGVVGHAQVCSVPEFVANRKLRYLADYPWVFRLDCIELYLDNPNPVLSLINQLDCYRGHVNRHWGWFVQTTRKISAHDFEILTTKRQRAA